jgi:flagellar biosynthesis anti-sigma factor FlgM
MVSTIKGTGTATPHTIDATPRQSGRTADAGPAPQTGASDVVTLTDLAARLQKLTDAVRDLPVVDQARVSAFKDAIANGDYAIDEQAVADKLSAFEAELGGRS